MSEYAVKVDQLTVAYEEKVVLDKIDWAVPKGALAAIIGPNGGGKSTLLKSLLGMIPPLTGNVLLFGEPPVKARRKVAYLPQWEEVDWLFPITALEVVLQGRLVHRRWWQSTAGKDRELASQVLAQVGMERWATQPIGALSGGQKQRVFLARALAQEAELIILDEPATGLDAAAQHDLLALFEQLQGSGHTVVITTHDLNCLAEHFDQVLGLNNQVIVKGDPQEVLDAQVLTGLFAKHFPMMQPSGKVAFHEH